MKREIIVFGHGGPKSHFRSKQEFIDWTKKSHKKYHYPVNTNAETIVLSHSGLAVGHFEIDGIKRKSTGKETAVYLKRRSRSVSQRG